MINKIGIVTVLYKSESVLPEFFDSLEKQTFKNFVLYIIDNKSPDNSLAISEKFKTFATFETIVIANDQNYGVAKGNNIGIKKAIIDHCDLVLLSNNDVIFGPTTIENLLLGMQKNKADMVVPKIYFHGTKTIWCTGGEFVKRNGWASHIGYEETDKGQYDTAFKTDYSPTCFMLIKKTVFDTLGLMDENYFVYWDDTDFIFRAKKNKFVLFYIPDSIVEHKESTSTGLMSDFSIYYKFRNLIYFSLKNYNIFYAFYVILLNLVYHFSKNLVDWKFHQWKIGLKAYLAGFKLICCKKAS